MKKFIALLFSFAAVCSVAQTAYQQKIQSMQTRMSSIDTVVDRIKTSKQVDLNAASQIDQDLTQYAADAMDAYRASMQQMQNASQANQPQQVTAIHNEWETFVQQQRTHVDQLMKELADIDVKVRTGDIMLSRDVVDSLTAPQRLEFRRSLKPQVDQEYQRKFPQRFPTLPHGMGYMSDEEWRQNAQCSSCVDVGVPKKSDIGLLSDKLGLTGPDIASEWSLVPKANAAAGIACYATCAASLGLACATCVASGVAGGVEAYHRMQACYGGCCRCKWYKPWCCACKPACVAAFLAYLA